MPPAPTMTRRMLSSASTMPEFTTRTLAQRIGADQNKVADMIGVYYRRGSGHFCCVGRDGRYRVYTTFYAIDYAPTQQAREVREAAARRERWLVAEEEKKRAEEAARKARAETAKRKTRSGGRVESLSLRPVGIIHTRWWRMLARGSQSAYRYLYFNGRGGSRIPRPLDRG